MHFDVVSFVSGDAHISCLFYNFSRKSLKSFKNKTKNKKKHDHSCLYYHNIESYGSTAIVTRTID